MNYFLCDFIVGLIWQSGQCILICHMLYWVWGVWWRTSRKVTKAWEDVEGWGTLTGLCSTLYRYRSIGGCARGRWRGKLFNRGKTLLFWNRKQSLILFGCVENLGKVLVATLKQPWWMESALGWWIWVNYSPVRSLDLTKKHHIQSIPWLCNCFTQMKEWYSFL